MEDGASISLSQATKLISYWIEFGVKQPSEYLSLCESKSPMN
jgi:hypothetical protein